MMRAALACVPSEPQPMQARAARTCSQRGRQAVPHAAVRGGGWVLVHEPRLDDICGGAHWAGKAEERRGEGRLKAPCLVVHAAAQDPAPPQQARPGSPTDAQKPLHAELRAWHHTLSPPVTPLLSTCTQMSEAGQQQDHS